jgi:hypothetical protein
LDTVGTGMCSAGKYTLPRQDNMLQLDFFIGKKTQNIAKRAKTRKVHLQCSPSIYK